jgi:hypothetical protein
MHRSIRHVQVQPWRLTFWLTVALIGTVALVWYSVPLVHGYRFMVNSLLQWTGIPFEAGKGEMLSHIWIPNWNIGTFNPVVSPRGFWTYGLVIVLGQILIWRASWIPLPLAAWIAAILLVLLLAILILHWRPEPILTPLAFSVLWGKVTIGTVLIYPCLWALLVGILPLPISRVAFWGCAALVFFLAWNIVRLAFFLALARWAGVVWLPIGIVFGGTLPDCLVLITAFAFVMEKVGPLWDELA